MLNFKQASQQGFCLIGAATSNWLTKLTKLNYRQHAI